MDKPILRTRPGPYRALLRKPQAFRTDHAIVYFSISTCVLADRYNNASMKPAQSFCQGVSAAMRLSKEALSIKVVVRRTRRGATPFVWEINRDSMSEPVFVSSETFVSMEEAFRAGHARLAEFTPVRGSEKTESYAEIG
jgi:hypothetical protein